MRLLALAKAGVEPPKLQRMRLVRRKTGDVVEDVGEVQLFIMVTTDPLDMTPGVIVVLRPVLDRALQH